FCVTSYFYEHANNLFDTFYQLCYNVTDRKYFCQNRKTGEINMVTQNQIAEIAGVSRATVERVINNRGDVSAATRKRVLDIIQEMNYRPNRAGKTLAIRQKNLKIGCIIVRADNPFYSELNSGIQEKAEEFKSYGFEVI